MDDERQNQPEGGSIPPPQPPPTAAGIMEPGQPQQQPPKTSGMAIASLVLGLLGLLTCVTIIPGLILGIIALVQINKNPTNLKGQGMALAGTIISAIGMIFFPMMAAIMFPVFARARDAAQKTNCMNNVKQLSLAVNMYCADWDDHYPIAENWNDKLNPYVKKPGIWCCPSAESKQPGYAFNAQLSGIKTGAVAMPPDTVVIFESIPGVNQVGGADLFPYPARHVGMHNVGFADGHSQMVTESDTKLLNFDPAETTPPILPGVEEEEPPVGGG